MGRSDLVLDGEDVGGLVRWVAHDAFIYGGNSGGPLINMQGEIVGINEISMALAGAIPGNLAQTVSEALMYHGKVTRAWTGITIQPLFKNDERQLGALVSGAIEGSPADEAGVQSGDILLALNGVPTQVRFDEDIPILNQQIVDLPIGEELSLEVFRDGQKKFLKITPTERQSMQSKQSELKEWGITIRNITFMKSKELRRDSQDGVLISSIRPGGPAGDAKPNLLSGDIITHLADKPIQNVEELKKATQDLLTEEYETTPVLVTFDRKKKTYVTVANIGLRELSNPGLEVKKAWLPIETQVLTSDIATALGMPDRKGFRVIQVYPESTAEKAGLKEGDIIYRIDEEPLTASEPEHYEELPAFIRNYRAGSTVTLDIARADGELSIDVELIRAPKSPREMNKYRDDNFEFTARNTAFIDEASGNWDSENGVLVDEVKRGGWAAIGLLFTNDLIQEVNGQPIEDVEQLRESMDLVEQNQTESVQIKVMRGIYTVYIELEPEWESD
jgi:serine protease Do